MRHPGTHLLLVPAGSLSTSGVCGAWLPRCVRQGEAEIWATLGQPMGQAASAPVGGAAVSAPVGGAAVSAGKRVHPIAEPDARELRKKLKLRVTRFDPTLPRTPPEPFPGWCEQGPAAASIVRSSSGGSFGRSSAVLGEGSYGSIERVTTVTNGTVSRLAMKVVSSETVPGGRARRTRCAGLALLSSHLPIHT